MAIFLFSIGCIDGKGKRANFNVPVPQGILTLADLQDFMDVFSLDVDNIMDAKVDRASVRVGLNISGSIKASPVAVSDVEEGALWSLDALATSYNHGVWVPGLKEALFIGADVDRTAPVVTVFESDLVTGITPVSTNQVSPSDRYENDVVGVVSAVKKFRK